MRFLFVWPRERYLSVDVPREDVDLAIDENALDLSGWDLRKSLRLLRKSNGPLIEWLHSPIVYRESSAVDKLRDLESAIFRPGACPAHYLGLSKRMILGIDESPEKATAKCYLYALRSLLYAGHVLRAGMPAPVAFVEVLQSAGLQTDLRAAIDATIAGKSKGNEADAIGLQPLIDHFLKVTIQVMQENTLSRPFRAACALHPDPGRRSFLACPGLACVAPLAHRSSGQRPGTSQPRETPWLAVLCVDSALKGRNIRAFTRPE